MTSRARTLTKIGLLIIFFASSTACTTTTKKLTTTEPRIDSNSQLAKARQAFNQKNYEQSASLLTPLAEQGDADAQYALGYMYHNGLGVPRNYKLAIQWMTAASAKGNTKATEALRLISELDSDVTDNNLQEESSQPSQESMEPILISGKKPDPITAMEPETKPVSPPAESHEQPAPEPEQETEMQPAAEKMAQAESAPDTTAEVAADNTSDNNTKKTMLSSDEQWIMDQPDTNFTIQLLSTGNLAALKQFINENNLQDSTRYYKSQRNSKDWYTLIQGSYDSPSMARTAINELPIGIQDLKPWVKPVSGIQETLSSR